MRIYPLILCTLLLGLLTHCTVESPSSPSPSIVHTLSELLQHDPAVETRRTAAMSLGKIGNDDGLPALLHGLKDADPLVRKYSAWALGQTDTPLTSETSIQLIMALGDPEQSVKEAAAAALNNAEPSEDFLRLFQQVLAISEPSTRLAVVRALSVLELPSSYPVFLAALKDPSPRIRQAALSGLGELGDAKAVVLFRKVLLNDPDEGVRTEAAFRLGKLGNANDLPALKTAVESDPTANVHLWASWAIEEISSSPEI